MKRELLWVLMCACASSGEPTRAAMENAEREQSDEAVEIGENSVNSGSGGNGSIQSNSDTESTEASARADQAQAGSGGATDSANGEAGAGAEGGTMGEAGTASEGGTTGEGGAAMQSDAPCPTPPGEDVVAIEYVPAATAAGCNVQAQQFQVNTLSSVNVESEAEFLDVFSCPEGAASGIDFESQLLRVTVLREAGFIAPTRLYARRAGGVVQLGFLVPPYCGGPFPPTAVELTLLPAGTSAVEDEVCKPGDCGAGGFPP